jgi:hypothetical protein
MDDIEKERELFASYPAHIAMLVKIAQRLIKEGRLRIEDGQLVMNPPKPVAEDPSKPISDGD